MKYRLSKLIKQALVSVGSLLTLGFNRPYLFLSQSLLIRAKDELLSLL